MHACTLADSPLVLWEAHARELAPPCACPHPRAAGKSPGRRRARRPSGLLRAPAADFKRERAALVAGGLVLVGVLREGGDACMFVCVCARARTGDA